MPKISLNRYQCIQCGQCTLVCPNRIFQRKAAGEYPACIEGSEELCISCYHCVAACPVGGLTVGTIGHYDCWESSKNVAVRFEHIAHLVRNRRSIRRYSDKLVTDQTIEQLLDVVRWAPTAKNGLPVKWVIVNNAEKVRELAGLVMDWIKEQPNSERMVEVWNNGGDPIFRGAPCVIGAYTDDVSAAWAPIDTAIAVETLDLCAAAKRLGSCWAGIFVRAAQSSHKSVLHQWLGLSEVETIHGGLMLGHIGEEVYQKIPYRPEAPKIWIR